MGIAGSLVEPSFFEESLGMRCESVDMTEIIRRVNENIFDPEEYERALAWTRENCKEGEDFNPSEQQMSAAEKDAIWEYVVKMTIIARDLMIGNPRLTELGFGEEALGHNAIASGFQGQRQWTDHMPNGDFKDVYSVMTNWGANHGAFSYGHIGADLITLASMLRIPVCMHNVDESDIFRPSAKKY